MDKILLTTGGTGGHIFPALAVAEELRRRNPDIHWIFWEKERNFAYALQIATEILTREGLQ